MGAVPVVQRLGLDLLLRRGGVSGGSGVGRDDLSRFSSSILHAVLSNGRLRAAQLADLRARTLQHGTTDPVDVFGYAHVRGLRSVEKYPGAHNLAQLVECVRVRRAHRQPSCDGELGDDAFRVGHLATRSHSLARVSCYYKSNRHSTEKNRISERSHPALASKA